MGETVAQVIIKALYSWDIKNIFGVSGNAVLPLMDALGKQNMIQFYSTAAEQGAAFMAGGEARATEKPGVCLATEGPGALNLINGIADAYRDGIPMLVITGQVETAKINTNAKQYFDQQQLFAPITGSTTLLTRPESVVQTLQVAMEKAIGDSVPCHISIPKDIFQAPVPANLTFPVLSPKCPPGVSGNMDDFCKVLDHSQKPVFITGKTAIRYKERILAFAKKIGAGIIPGQGARGIYPGLIDNLLGGLGEAHIVPVLQNADCILIIGASPYEHKFIPGGLNVDILQIDTKPQNIAHSLRPLSLTGDINSIVETLHGRIKEKITPDWREQIRHCHINYIEMIRAEMNIQDIPVSPRAVIAALNETITEDAIITIDSGEFMHWFDRGFIPQKQDVIISEYWRCMGNGLPMGIGAKTAFPERKVIVLTGDGGFIMTMQEIITAIRYSLPVVIIIFNNSCYLLEKHRMQQNNNMAPFGTDVANPDFVSFATSCGAEGIRVERPEHLHDALAKAMSVKNTIVVDVIVNGEKPMF